MTAVIFFTYLVVPMHLSNLFILSVFFSFDDDNDDDYEIIAKIRFFNRLLYEKMHFFLRCFASIMTFITFGNKEYILKLDEVKLYQKLIFLNLNRRKTFNPDLLFNIQV